MYLSQDMLLLVLLSFSNFLNMVEPHMVDVATLYNQLLLQSLSTLPPDVGSETRFKLPFLTTRLPRNYKHQIPGCSCQSR